MSDLSSVCPPITTTSSSSSAASAASANSLFVPPHSHGDYPLEPIIELRSHRRTLSPQESQNIHRFGRSETTHQRSNTLYTPPRRSRRSTASDPSLSNNNNNNNNNMSSHTSTAAASSSASHTTSNTSVTGSQQNTTDVILTRVFQDQTNVLKRDDRELIIEFLNGRLRVNPFDPSTSLHRIILNEAKHKDPLHPTRTTIEQIVFEMNFTSGHWRKLRRKAVVRDAVASERFEEHVSKDECPGAEWWGGRIPAGWDSNGNKIDSIGTVTTVTTKHASLAVASREIYVCGR